MYIVHVRLSWGWMFLLYFLVIIAFVQSGSPLIRKMMAYLDAKLEAQPKIRDFANSGYTT